MTFPSTPILDAFNRSNEGPPMTGWTDTIAGFKVASNQAVGNTAGNNVSYVTGLITNAACEAYATMATIAAPGKVAGVFLRFKDVGSGATMDGYLCYLGPLLLRISRIDNGSETALATYSTTGSSGDLFGIRAEGSRLTGWHNTGGGWAQVIDVTDTTYPAGGYIGLFSNDTSPIVDDFGGGSITGKMTPNRGVW